MRLTKYLLLLGLLFLSSCGGGGGGNQPPPGNTRLTLNGIVRDNTGTALAGVAVLLSLNHTVTDSQGRFTYSNLPAGSYIVSLQDPAGNYDSRSVTLSDGSTDFNFSLPGSGGLRVVRTQPALNGSAVPLDVPIVLEFSDAPLKSSISAEDFELSPPLGGISLAVNGTSLEIIPQQQFPTSQSILLEYTGTISSGTGQMDQPLRLRFTTAASDTFGPRLVNTRPFNMAVNYPPNLPISFDFNEELLQDTSGIKLSVQPQTDLQLRVSGASLLVSRPGGWDINSDYSVTVDFIRDTLGNLAEFGASINFRTGEQVANARNAEADWNLDSDTIVFSSNLNGSYDIFSIRPDGSDLSQLTDLTGDERSPTLNADGSLLAFQRRDNEGFWQVMLLPLKEQQAQVVQLTSPGYNNTDPYFSRTFSNDIAFTSTRQSVTGLWSVSADNLLETELDESFGSGQSDPVFHPLIDGQLLFQSGRSGNQDIWRKTISVISGESININLTLQLLSNEHSPAWSPDASFFAFISDFDGTDNLWTADATGALQTQLTFLDVDLDDPVIDPVSANNRCVVTMDNGSGGSDLVLVDLTSGEILLNLTGV